MEDTGLLKRGVQARPWEQGRVGPRQNERPPPSLEELKGSGGGVWEVRQH